MILEFQVSLKSFWWDTRIQITGKCFCCQSVYLRNELHFYIFLLYFSGKIFFKVKHLNENSEIGRYDEGRFEKAGHGPFQRRGIVRFLFPSLDQSRWFGHQFGDCWYGNFIIFESGILQFIDFFCVLGDHLRFWLEPPKWSSSDEPGA